MRSMRKTRLPIIDTVHSTRDMAGLLFCLCLCIHLSLSVHRSAVAGCWLWLRAASSAATTTMAWQKGTWPSLTPKHSAGTGTGRAH
jgi:hypothetical protein